ncbi:MAG TPA: antibiotic biosynthesis monooxygenase [Phycisphaerales bacterium]|nr:antibiotic biosynthesis monooxygenase [Phycisphaerales bacterium]HMP38270.1 antibiotic biosynthesis monooxygenase [Phycisphaerales bacterium]
MGDEIHIAITRRVRRGHLAEFERRLADFASRALAEPGARGMHLLHPPPGSGSAEYGILHSFAGAAERDAFHRSPLYQQWLEDIAPLTEGEAVHRELTGLEAWFRRPGELPPPRWKMAVLTWVAVWPVSMIVPLAILPFASPFLHPILAAGVIAAGIVIVLTWVAMPLLAKLAHPWLRAPALSQKHEPENQTP